MIRGRTPSRTVQVCGIGAAFLVLIPASVVLHRLLGPSDYVHAQANQPAGGDLIPIRQVSDPYPVFNGIAIDLENNLVAMSDVNRKSVLSYSRTAESGAGGITAPTHHIFGPLTNIGFVAGIALD